MLTYSDGLCAIGLLKKRDIAEIDIREERASFYILIIKTTRYTNFPNLFLE